MLLANREVAQRADGRTKPSSTMSDGRIYVGNLPVDIQERDIEDLFYKYGKIRDIELKNNRGTIPFAFVRFEDPRDADDAVYGRNGYGLPPTGSWQDLKDHMREAGDVCFADVQRDGEGVVEFLRREDMEYALRRLDRTEFRSHQGETAYIRVFEERGTPNCNRSQDLPLLATSPLHAILCHAIVHPLGGTHRKTIAHRHVITGRKACQL
ncbi:Serine/arginine-rich splicing factor 9 [Liparis tanakae]|uniref:Serine/arginine-rich splicing factor 9 n=1 Tax=Liparis tanakae TaxID=230148 RepID=A0A4Z2ITU4_9TELE|nr:Serine/arginine-rich splicing factor 9 [Liparis tanakae]